VGLAMGQQIVNAMQGPAARPAAAPAAVGAPPPPMSTQSQWYITRDGQNFGPFAANQLLANGLTPQSYVWRNGLSGWQQATTIPELASLFPAAPPPPMPQ
jgi:alkylhydroperoxidase family enzyme